MNRATLTPQTAPAHALLHFAGIYYGDLALVVEALADEHGSVDTAISSEEAAARLDDYAGRAGRVRRADKYDIEMLRRLARHLRGETGE